MKIHTPPFTDNPFARFLDRESKAAIKNSAYIDGMQVVTERGDEMEVRPINWLWDGWLAEGKLHLIGGVASSGKTNLALALASVVTNGGLWPDGSISPAGDVVFWTGEDGNEDTILPRFIAMGGDRSRIHFIKGVFLDDEFGTTVEFDPGRHMKLLSQAVARLGSVKLVIVDPVMSMVAGDSNQASIVRRSMSPLVEMGEKLGVAIIGITHFSKGSVGRDPLDRILGSGAFGALARIVLVTVRFPENMGKKPRLVRIKSNIGPDGSGFEYSILPENLVGHPDITASRVEWGQALVGDPVELTSVEDAAADPEDSACDFLKMILAEPMPAKDVYALAQENGYSQKQMLRAAKKINARQRRDGFGKDAKYIWSLQQ